MKLCFQIKRKLEIDLLLLINVFFSKKIKNKSPILKKIIYIYILSYWQKWRKVTDFI